MNVFAFLNVDDPWIAWLVYRGEMVSSKATKQQIISVWHTKYICDAAKSGKKITNYKRELAIEEIRKRLFIDRVSRLSGLYFFESSESALQAGKRWDGNFKEEYLAEIKIHQMHNCSKYDSEWITHHMNSTDESWISQYLSGQPMSTQPLWELLIEGRGFVLGTQVRQRAYETIKRKWPNSLGLLELSRVAVELNSDLGLISPVITINQGTAVMNMYLNFEDAQKREFLEKFSKYDGPKNTADLNQHPDLVVPDLTEYFVQFNVI
jgi:hypothetical protein